MVKRKAVTLASDAQPEATEQDAQPAKVAKTDIAPGWKNKEKVLLLSSRGITHRWIIHATSITTQPMICSAVAPYPKW